MTKRRLVIALFFIFLPVLTLTAKPHMSKETKACIKCHNEKNIHIVQIKEWEKSSHAKKGTGCFECHQAKKGEPDAWDHEGYTISTIVSPFDCAKCHRREFEEFDRSHHSKAGEILGSLDNYLGEVVQGEGASVQGCAYCHGSVVKMDKDKPGKMDPMTWPNLGIGRLNPDGSKGSCSACHAKHAFSLEVARSPDSCGKCHMGPDHPQKEIFEESKHGIIYKAHLSKMKLDSKKWILGKEYTQAPNCVTCHMGAAKNIHRTHDLGERISMDLRSPISKPKEDQQKKMAEMKKVCANCHGPEWYNNFYKQFYATVDGYENRFGKTSAAIINSLLEEGKLTKTPFDEEIEWVYFELWHHEGRRLRHGAAMMGPDFVQWHGFYEVAQHFYFKFIPKAEKLAGEKTKKLIAGIMSRPEHRWMKGYTPGNLRIQEAAYKEWAKMREAALAERKNTKN